ncbi:hypothetical protein AB1Y20_015041 [Prymnesium parvum]|uniref:GT23 domain-containing protein n=1 Tax=Prymnesium parvum TaxID=97485 RepID=A0AB34JYY7_PRYPA
MACPRVSYYPALVASPPRADQSPLETLSDDHPCTTPADASSAGLAFDGKGCVDLGAGEDSSPWHPMAFLPSRESQPSVRAEARASELRSLLRDAQFSSRLCSLPTPHILPVSVFPLIGFGQTLEFLNLAVSQAASMGRMLVLGRYSSFAWTSAWYCGDERSLRCYFNLSLCCADSTFDSHIERGAERIKLKGLQRMENGKQPDLRGGDRAVRKGALGITRKGGALPGNHRAIRMASFDMYGSLWLTGQVSQFVFSTMWPAVRREVSRRRNASSIPSGELDMIGMHVRRGDSCALRSRYCPTNRTEAYFLKAATLRAAYGVNKLLVATDDPVAAEMCGNRPLGFHCFAMPMNRERFQAFTSIELRVAKEERQCNNKNCRRNPLSGSRLALNTLTDIDMLADCRFLVVNLRASISRLALSMAVARRRRHVPFISVQWPWEYRPGPKHGLSGQYARGK